MSEPKLSESSEDRTTVRSSDASSPAPGAEFQPGQLIAGRYRMVGSIGKGGMGEVYRVQDLTLDQEVALKFLPQELASDPHRLALFHQEVRLARKVTHPHVCRMHDIGEFDSRPFLSMEYVRGEDLASLIRRVGRLPEERGLELARQLCAGLAAAHDQGVLHRDLKPANVLIDENGNVRITDFGLAGAIGEIEDVGSGTPAYMAPEQLKGNDVTARSDLFSLGLVLYEVFTGRKAYDAKTVQELLRVHSGSSIPTPTSAVRELSPQTESVILRCLQTDPDQRPESALSVSAALPGGDPLAEALAAGRTPSPDLVAAAGGTSPVPAASAVLSLSVALVGFAAVYFLRPSMVLFNQVPLDKSPVVLVDRAASILDAIGARDLPHHIFGFTTDQDYLDFIAARSDADDRWNDLGPHVLRFWYRESPNSLVPVDSARSRPRINDPPLAVPHMARLELDWEGRLLELVTIPPESAETAEAPTSWSALFEFAEIDEATLAPAEPEWNPPVFADSRSAWANDAVRVEAASLAGRPVWFRVVRPWQRPREAIDDDPSSFGRVLTMVGTVVVMMVLASACLLALRHVRLGRGDRERAFRLAVVVFGLNVATWLSMSVYYFDLNEEFQHFMNGVMTAVFSAALIWLLYMALEPYVRRIWPQGLIGWTRLFSGKYRDPVVGRDILVGAAAGAVMAFGAPFYTIAKGWLGLPPSVPSLDGSVSLLGFRHSLLLLMSLVNSSINNALLIVLMFVVTWMIVRRAWAALLVLGVLLSILIGVQVTPSVAGFVYLLFIYAMGATVLWRFGLLALVTALFFEASLRQTPFTHELSEWYATPTITTLTILTTLTVLAFVSSRAGEPVFGRAIVPD